MSTCACLYQLVSVGGTLWRSASNMPGFRFRVCRLLVVCAVFQFTQATLFPRRANDDSQSVPNGKTRSVPKGSAEPPNWRTLHLNKSGALSRKQGTKPSFVSHEDDVEAGRVPLNEEHENDNQGF